MNGKVNILIVDDEPNNRKLIKLALSKGGYDIAEAADGSDALEQIKANSPDLILLDIMMPVLNGWEVIKILKSSPETTHIPIILITALDNYSDKIKGLELGANDYLGKPINLSVLKSLVKSMIKSTLNLDVKKTEYGETASNRTPHLSVLLVEDDEKQAKLVQNYLPAENYQIAWADTGEKAVEMAGGEEFDLILLDILLPDMNGFEVLDHLTQMQSVKSIPIIAISVLDDSESKIKAIDLGANVYLTKPVDKNEFNIRIRNLTMKTA